MGEYGSGGAEYLEKVTISTSTSTSTERSLRVKFVRGERKGNAPSFFPQVPHDIFYPLHLLQ